jgi:UTP--glucose-1-phosphate uridylyltransferase
LLDDLRSMLPSWATCVYIRQPAPLGLGHAVLCARPVVGDAPFMVHLADDLIDAEVPCLKQMVEVFMQARRQRARRRERAAAGHRQVRHRLARAQDVGARRQIRTSSRSRSRRRPSNLAVVGRYLLSGAIFDDLAQIGAGAGGEIQLTDGIARLMQREPVYAYEFDGKRYDCGNKLGYLQATVEYGLKHESLGADFAAYLKEFVAKL